MANRFTHKSQKSQMLSKQITNHILKIKIGVSTKPKEKDHHIKVAVTVKTQKPV